WRVKLPAILFLLLAGIFLGPGINWLKPDQLLGDLFFPLVSLSVAIILFEGSLTLRFKEIKGLAHVVRRLVSLGALITWGVTSTACHLLLNFSWSMSLLMGSLVVVTGPTVVIPMLRSVRPNRRIANVLRWEGIMIDPIGALLAVLVYESIISLGPGEDFSHTFLLFLQMLLTGGLIGCVTGYALGLILRFRLLPIYLHNLGTIAVVLMAFTASNTIREESGLLCVTVMGVWLANMRDVNIADILSFKENLSILLISGLFILLAARIEFDDLMLLGWPACILLLVMQFVARPLAVAAATLNSDLTWQERTLISWIGPRGIVAAAVSAFFALRLESAGFAEAKLLVPITFIIIIGTVILQSITARSLARLLKVDEPSPRGFLVVGANDIACSLATALKDVGFSTLLTDTNWDNISTARMMGFNTFYGNPVSEYADTHLDLVGIGRLLAVSPQRDFNAVACMRYRPEFGEHNLFSIPVIPEKTGAEKLRVSSRHKGRTLFSQDLTYSKFASLLKKGAKIRTTGLTETYSFEDLLQDNKAKLYPLFAINKSGRLHVITQEDPIKPGAGWSVISLDYKEIDLINTESQTGREIQA
ncbi:MAG: sodium:proton antiporter, partial [Pseudomonadales bacterium]|nr:sodium:proton antiporter [Pseudomonadales bacterium]